jgi:uncharacterized membrane protein
MDKKYFGGRYILLPILIALLIAASLSSLFLDYGGWDRTALNRIVAGIIIGVPVFMVIWLVMVLIRAAARRSDK